MNMQIVSKKKADAISNGVFLVSLGILFYTNSWWPGILLGLWAYLATRQYLMGRVYDFILTSIILIGLFIVSFFKIDWTILTPILFVLGGIYIIFREFFYAEDYNGEPKDQEMKDDIQDAKDE